MRQPWIEDGVKQNIDVLTEFRNNRHTKKKKKPPSPKVTDYIGDHGELSVRSDQKRIVQISKVYPPLPSQLV